MIYQLAKNITIQSRSAFTSEQLTKVLIQINEDLCDENDILNESGCSTTVIKKLCEEYNIPIHIKWGAYLNYGSRFKHWHLIYELPN